MQAAILNIKLTALDRENERRREIAATYGQELAGLPIVLPRERAGAMHVYHLYVIVCGERERLRAALAASGVSAGIHYPVPGHRHPGYDARCRVPSAGLPVTERLSRQVLSLPMYPELTDQQRAVVTDAMRQQVIYER